MTPLSRVLALTVTVFMPLFIPGLATGQPVQTDPAKGALFINMTTGDSWRGWMGLHFADNTLRQGHPVTVFLNLEAVKLAALTIEQEKPSMQRLPRDIVADFVKNGGADVRALHAGVRPHAQGSRAGRADGQTRVDAELHLRAQHSHFELVRIPRAAGLTMLLLLRT